MLKIIFLFILKFESKTIVFKLFWPLRSIDQNFTDRRFFILKYHMLFYIFIFIKCILGASYFSECNFEDSIKSLSNDKLQLTPTIINKNHFCNIHDFFDVTFESDPQTKIQIT